MSKIPDILSETGERETAKDNPTSKSLEELAKSPASELFVLETHRDCWPKQWIRRFRTTLAIFFGSLVVLQGSAFVVFKYYQKDTVREAADKAASMVQKDAAREAALQVLRELRISGSLSQSAPLHFAQERSPLP